MSSPFDVTMARVRRQLRTLEAATAGLAGLGASEHDEVASRRRRVLDRLVTDFEAGGDQNGRQPD
ncbi:hypothetical protein [Mycolicibacterium goodii]|uniref:Uncharacterized protein n=1 Tax=Mycolicibacterium goodii TaxID=134601 RepID=A0A0K0XDR5_MYCGD|nr:hypothetical protein AFA91_30495 [Mycolicibacterium goodii]